MAELQSTTVNGDLRLDSASFTNKSVPTTDPIFNSNNNLFIKCNTVNGINTGSYIDNTGIVVSCEQKPTNAGSPTTARLYALNYNGFFSKGGLGNLGSSSNPWYTAYFKYMPKIDGTSLIKVSGGITGNNGISLKFADGSQICYGYFSKSVAMTNAFGNIYYGTASNNITFSTKFTTNPAMLVTLQDNDAINVSIMDQGGLTASSYTGRWLFNSPVSTTKTMTVSWVAFGLWK